MANPTEEDLRVARNLVLRISNRHLRDESVRSQLSFDIASAIATEREKAAKVAEMKFAAVTGTWSSHYVNAGIAIAAAIRAVDKQ